jgi:hypothetical protein
LAKYTAIVPDIINSFNEVTRVVDATLGTSGAPFYYDSSWLNSYILRLFSGSHLGDLARGSCSTTISAIVLRSLQTPPSLLRTIELVDGQLACDGQYYKSLDTECSFDFRPEAERSIVSRPRLGDLQTLINIHT